MRFKSSGIQNVLSALTVKDRLVTRLSSLNKDSRIVRMVIFFNISFSVINFKEMQFSMAVLSDETN